MESSEKISYYLAFEDPPYLGQSEWDQKVRTTECVFSLYDVMKLKWDDVYVLQGSDEYILSGSLSTPVTTVSPCSHCGSLMMYLDAGIERDC